MVAWHARKRVGGTVVALSNQECSPFGIQYAYQAWFKKRRF